MIWIHTHSIFLSGVQAQPIWFVMCKFNLHTSCASARCLHLQQKKLFLHIQDMSMVLFATWWKHEALYPSLSTSRFERDSRAHCLIQNWLAREVQRSLGFTSRFDRAKPSATENRTPKTGAYWMRRRRIKSQNRSTETESTWSRGVSAHPRCGDSLQLLYDRVENTRASRRSQASVLVHFGPLMLQVQSPWW